MRDGALAGLVTTALALMGCPGRPATPPPTTAQRELGAPRVTAGQLDGRALLATLPARASALGAGPISVVAVGEAFEGERMGAFVDVPVDVCLLGYARASASVEDLDVAFFSDEGTPLAVDEAPDAHPTVLLCPPHPERVYVGAHAASGEGLVALGVQLVPRDRAERIAKELGARGSVGGAPRPPDNWPGLEDSVRKHREALGGRWEEFRKVVLSVDARAPTYFPFPIEGGQCTDAVILPGEEVSLLDVEALDAEGRVVARAKEGGRGRALTVCSSLAVAGSLAIRPHVGRGLAAIVLARARGEVAADLTARPDVAWASAPSSLGAVKSARNDELAKHGYDRAVIAVDGALALGRRATVPLDLKSLATPCARIDALAGAPLALLEAAAWDDSGALVAAGEGSASVTLFACTHAQARLDLETHGHPGPYAVLVRPEPWKDAAFTAHPLAAARMLARAAEGPSRLHEGAVTGARAVSLDPAHMSSWTRAIPAGKCQRVAAGAQGDGAGLELRVFDNASNDELDRSHAAHAVSVRACAPAEAGRVARFELRVTSGKLDAVIGERQ